MDSNITLEELDISQKAIVEELKGEEIPTKIAEMGIVPGVEVKIRNKAPFKGPIAIEYGEDRSMIVLRRDEAHSIIVKVK